LKTNFSKADRAEDIIRGINKLLLSNYFGSKDDDAYVSTFGIYGTLVFGDGRIWDVSGCLSLTEIPKGKLWARGSGAEYAIGANYAIEKTHPEMPAKDRLSLSVDAAIENDIHCVGEAVVKTWPDLLTLS
jgi:ATP-dependent protease HslVU (ClpYQ) peptidase subunit